MTKLITTLLLACFSPIAFAGYYPMYSSWEQDNGPGSDITLTYSYSNLFNGTIIDSYSGTSMDASLLRSIFVRAFQDYADVLPIHFVEVADNSGPLPETGEYNPEGLADIRIGLVPHIDNANAYAYFPYTGSGLAGDIVFNAERSGFQWTSTFFYAVAQHEIGHSLGMGHYVDADPVIAALYAEPSEYAGPLFPLHPEMITALQGVYGAGTGSVTALPLPGSLFLFLSSLLAPLVRSSLIKNYCN